MYPLLLEKLSTFLLLSRYYCFGVSNSGDIVDLFERLDALAIS